MKFASLGSGSSGNATVIAAGGTLLLVDCGFGIRETTRRLQRLNLCPEDIAAIVVTHEHTDHIKGVFPLSRKFSIPVYLTRGTYLSRDFGDTRHARIIDRYRPFTVGDIDVTPVPVPHDAREPAQYLFAYRSLTLGVLTDLGSVTRHVVERYAECDGFLVEANHDLTMLANGPYPYVLQKRVGSNWGHLNNFQTANLLEQLNVARLQQLVIGHISQKNNAVACVRDALTPSLDDLSGEVFYACQDRGFDWLAIA